MSMLSEQVNQLKEEAEWLEKDQEKRLASILRQAADTIEALSAKLAAANMERSDRYCGGGWISCKDRTPDKQGLYIIHVITGTGEDYVGTWIYQQGVHLSGRQTYIDDKQGYWASPYSGDPVNEYLTQNFIAWQSMPEPYRP